MFAVIEVSVSARFRAAEPRLMIGTAGAATPALWCETRVFGTLALPRGSAVA